MPIEPCQLLTPYACAPGETCSVVDANGTAGCIAIGPGVVGDPCDAQHCGDGLACLGPVGQRTCWKLCHTDNPADCASGQTCKTGGALFPDPAVGVCQAH
jgi:hypothetical protein